MYDTKEFLENLLQNEKKEFIALSKELKNIKAGRIKMRRKGDKYYFTECIGKSEKGITNDSSKVEILLRKRYLEKRIKILEHNISIMEKASRTLYASKIEDDIFMAHGAKYTHEQWRWMKEPFNNNPLFRENLVYKSFLGTAVRSKSELNIINSLERNGIPYRYEQELIIDGHKYYPDLTILKWDFKEVIWEHLGLTQDEAYAEKSSNKLQIFEAAGFRRHDNLIVTYEDDIRSQKDIDEIIKRFFMP